MGFSSCNHPLQELLQDEKRNNYVINFSPSLEPNDENCSLRYNLKTWYIVCLFVFSFYFVSTDIIPAHLHHSFSM